MILLQVLSFAAGYELDGSDALQVSIVVLEVESEQELHHDEA